MQAVRLLKRIFLSAGATVHVARLRQPTGLLAGPPPTHRSQSGNRELHYSSKDDKAEPYRRRAPQRNQDHLSGGMLPTNGRENHREVGSWKKGEPHLLVLTVSPYEQRHHEFFEPQDRVQYIYEQARRATADQRLRLPEKVQCTLQAHGVAGLFLDPEQTFVDCTQRSRPGSRIHTAFHHTHLDETLFETIARSLTECVGVRATARITNTDKKTVLRVLSRAADHALTISTRLLKNLKISECQLDEMWSFIGKKEAHLEPIEKLEGILGDAWIWIAFDPVHKVVIAHVIGKRTEPHAVALLEEVKRVTVCTPELFTSDQLDQYKQALIQVYGHTILPSRKPGPGRPPSPRLLPPEDLLYAQVVKQYKNNRLASITRKVVFGEPRKVQGIIQRSEVSHTINTSFVERNNGTIRHMDARCTRKTYRFSKCNKNHENQFKLSLAYYHLCLPHKTLTKRYQRPTTPFMSAGLTDHAWTMHELLQTRPEDLDN